VRGRRPGGVPARYLSRCQGRQDCSLNSPPGGSTGRCRGLEQRHPLLSAATAARGGYAVRQPVSELPCLWRTAGLVNARAAAHHTAPDPPRRKAPGRSATQLLSVTPEEGASSQWYDPGPMQGVGWLVMTATCMTAGMWGPVAACALRRRLRFATQVRELYGRTQSMP
jgi:hypothetical protein